MAGIADVAAVVTLARETRGAPHWSEREYLRAVDPEEGRPLRCLLAVKNEQELAGFAAGTLLAGVGELESVVVRESARRKGVGRTLCEAVMEWAWEHGAEWIELEVRAGSTGAQRLYTGLGFRKCGRRRGYYNEPVEDAVLMRLERPNHSAEGAAL